MIHTSFFTYSTVTWVAVGVAVALLLSSARRPRYGSWSVSWSSSSKLGTSAEFGLAAAMLLTLFLYTYRHAALVRSAARAHQSVEYVLASGFVATFICVSAVTLIFLVITSRNR